MYNIFSSYIHEEIFNLDTIKIKQYTLKLKSKDKGRVEV